MPLKDRLGFLRAAEEFCREHYDIRSSYESMADFAMTETAEYRSEVERLREDLATSERLRAHAVEELGKDSALVERLWHFVDFVNLWCWRESKISAEERVSAIQYHPTARTRAEAINQQTGSAK